MPRPALRRKRVRPPTNSLRSSGKRWLRCESAALEAETLLRTEHFDLVIVSAWLAEWDRERSFAAAGKTPVLVLTELTLAEDLLAKVERHLVQSAQDTLPA